jgi:hypothetical protein
MSVETRGPDRMPQPEQWLSDHWLIVAPVAFVLLAALIGWLAS